MEFIRKGDKWLFSCRIAWNHPDTKLKFTLFPMFHIGAKEYYDFISKDLIRFKYILKEGTSYNKNKYHMYDWGAKNLGLVAQEDFLKYPEKSEKLNIDMPVEIFKKRFIKINILRQLLIIFIRPFYWLITKIPSIKDYYRNHYSSIDQEGMQSSPVNDLDKLIITDRDKIVIWKIRKFYKIHKDVDHLINTAIIFGARHMPAIAKCLHDLGFHPASKKWITVFSPDK